MEDEYFGKGSFIPSILYLPWVLLRSIEEVISRDFITLLKVSFLTSLLKLQNSHIFSANLQRYMSF